MKGKEGEREKKERRDGWREKERREGELGERGIFWTWPFQLSVVLNN